MRVTLADYAAVNPDGSYTIVRGGLDRWRTNAPLPLQIASWAFIEFMSGGMAAGDMQFKMTVTREPNPSQTLAEGKLHLEQVGGVARLALPLQFGASAFATYTIEIAIGEAAGAATLHVEELKV